MIFDQSCEPIPTVSTVNQKLMNYLQANAKAVVGNHQLPEPQTKQGKIQA